MKSYILILLVFFCPLLASAQSEEFYGPFDSWVNLKQAYNAAGDGVQDDTKALQAALDSLGKKNSSPVLFIPKGVYRITSTLHMQKRLHIAIIGEDPLTTIIKWDGPAGDKMFLLNGVSYSEYARITWDGNNTASAAVAHEWNGTIKYANSGTQHTDEIFRNVGVGLKSGYNMDAEFTIRRCRFYNCSSTGISLQGWNALDWWVWDCYFENCNAGIANNLPTNGAGNFHVYRSIFKNSSTADISLGNSNYFSFRDNVSYNSAKFIIARQGDNTSPITLQHNLIINKNKKLMVDLYTKGNILLLDNTFVTSDKDSGYVIRDADNVGSSDPDLTMIGNSYTASDKIFKATTNSRVTDLDNRSAVTEPRLPSLNPKPFAPLVSYPVYEIQDSMPVSKIQSIIDIAIAAHKKAILHFKYGNYRISKTLKIPGGAPLILYGDAWGSMFEWSGRDSGKAIIEMDCPSQATIKNMAFDGRRKSDGIIVNDNDLPGNTIYANELLCYFGKETNILVHGFSHTDIRFENLQHNYSQGTSMDVVGNDSAKEQTSVKIFGGESAASKYAYNVSNGGRLIVFDAWYEGGVENFIKLRGSGELILNGMKIAPGGEKEPAFVDVDSFSGKMVLAQGIFNAPAPQNFIHFSNPFGNAKFLSIGNLSWNDSTSHLYDIHAPKETFAYIHDRYNVNSEGSVQLPSAGAVDDNLFLKEMLSTLRGTSVLPARVSSASQTHCTLDRVSITSCVNNFRIEKIN